MRYRDSCTAWCQLLACAPVMREQGMLSAFSFSLICMQAQPLLRKVGRQITCALEAHKLWVLLKLSGLLILHAPSVKGIQPL